MRSLGDALADLRRRNGWRFEPPDPTSPDEVERDLLDRMLWQTQRYEDDLAQISGPERGQIERLLELAKVRDYVHAKRPPGCWCLGLGGHGRVYLPHGDEPIPGWRVWCRCPDGQAMRQRYLELGAELRQQAVRDNLERLWGSVPTAFREWTLDSLAALGPLERRLVDQVRHWLASGRWLYLYGPTGRAKTGTAIGAMRELVAEGRTGLYCEVRDLLGHLRATYAGAEAFKSELDRLWESLLGVQVLLLDDLGAERATDWANETLGQLIAYRHRENLRTIITSNLDLVELGRHMNDARSSSRIAERSLLIDCGGLPNLRLPETR